MPINPNARTEAISFREGAAWMWQYLCNNGFPSVEDMQKLMTEESLRRYPDFDPLPQPTTSPKGGMEP
jgi:hypothetical protein